MLENADFENLREGGHTSLQPSRQRRKSSRCKPAIIVGATSIGIRMVKSLSDDPRSQFRVNAIFDDRRQERLGMQDATLLQHNIEDVPDYVRNQHVAAVFIALPLSESPCMSALLNRLQDTTASIYFVPHLEALVAINPRVNLIDGIPAFAICESPLHGIRAASKRGIDILLASLALVLLLPIFVLIALAVKLSSPGPVFFKQRRYGLDGKEIVIYKFRSMTVCEDGSCISQAIKHDPRVTPFGALLRKASLDELPQLINVVQGRMSLVGPRPHAVAHNEYYRSLIPGYMLRHKVRPGLTGWAQVHGLRGETETLELMRARIEYDLAYLRTWSLWLDLRIILLTPIALLSNRSMQCQSGSSVHELKADKSAMARWIVPPS